MTDQTGGDPGVGIDYIAVEESERFRGLKRMQRSFIFPFAVFFLASLLITFNFAMMTFTPAQFTQAWLAFGVTTAIALWLGRARFAALSASAFNMFVLWLFFFLAGRPAQRLWLPRRRERAAWCRKLVPFGAATAAPRRRGRFHACSPSLRGALRRLRDNAEENGGDSVATCAACARTHLRDRPRSSQLGKGPGRRNSQIISHRPLR